MQVVRLTATAGTDGVLRLAVPVGAAGEYVLVVTAVLKKGGRAAAADPLGWSATSDDAGGALDDISLGDIESQKPDPLGGLL